jgi:hypothetical protein
MGGRTFSVDETVRKILADWGRERDSDIGRLNLGRAAARLSQEQRTQLLERVAEISLGVLFAIDAAEKAGVDPADRED